MQKMTLILGAQDPEMTEIERLGRDAGCEILFAAVDGRRVHPGNAYQSDGLLDTRGRPASVDLCAPRIAVECLGWWAYRCPDELTEEHTPGSRRLCGACGSSGPSVRAVLVDHHRPGDYGFGRPAAEYWRASSLGQVCALLCVAPTPELRLVAAADHCLRAAYAGECPGVGPGDLAAWRLESRAAFQKIPASTLATWIETAARALRNATRIVIGDHVLRDMRGSPTPELPEAACRLGASYLAGPLPSPDGRKKYVVSGDEGAVRAWMASPDFGGSLVDVYGDPVRGFAGGYAVTK